MTVKISLMPKGVEHAETINILLKYKLQVTLNYRKGLGITSFTFYKGQNAVPIAVWESIRENNADDWKYWSEYFFEPVSK